MSYTQYIGRTVDVLAYRGANVHGGEARLTKQLVGDGDGGEITTGIQKLSQQFLLELLTVKGSVFAEPERGCSFMADARSGAWRTVTDVFVSFAAALADLETTFDRLDDETAPDDERYADAEIIAVTLAAGAASVSIRVTSQAGDSRVVIAPLSVSV